MIPVLFSSKATTFTGRGIGLLSDTISCKVVEERNGAFELEMTYPVDGLHYADIGERSIIMAIPSPYRSAQPFRVYSMEQPINGVVTIKARHLSYDMTGIPVEPFTLTGDVADIMDEIDNNASLNTGFGLQTDLTSSGTFTLEKPASMRSCLGGMEGSLLDLFGGEYLFDGYSVKLLASRGSVKDYKVAYAKNITAFKRTTDSGKLVTGIFPFWASGNDTQILTRKVVEIVEDADYTNVPVVDLTDKFESKPTKAELLAAAEKYISDNDLGELEVSLDVSFVDLASIDEYAGRARDLKIDLCDTVTIVFPMYGVETQAKIVRIETNVLLERYELITVGTEQTTVADTIASLQNQTQQLAVNNAGGGGGGGGSDVLALSISGNVISLSQNGSVVSSITLPVYGGGVS